jgi:hypothetical protein
MHEHEHVLLTGDPIGMIIVIIGTIATVLAFVIAIRATFWPGETDPNHPKNIIFREDL